LEERSDDEEEISWALGEAAGEVGVPSFAEGEIDSDFISFVFQLGLKVAADSVEHLPFE